jgi:tetratricopeptide (TPR) repeat protein
MYAACLNEIAYGVGRLLGNYHWAWFASEQALELSRAYRSAHATAIYLDTQAQLLLEMDRVEEAQKVIDEAIALLGEELTSTGQFSESLARRGMVYLRAGNLPRAVEDLEAARRAQTQRGEKLHLPDTLTSLALAYALLGDADRAVEASTEALRVLAAVRGVNHQPQRILWNHYKILARFDRQPRLHFLRRAVRSIEAQAARLTPAQARRFRARVPVNREILDAWAELHGAATAGAEPSAVAVPVPPAGREVPDAPVAAPTSFETPEPPAPSLRVS